MPQLQRPGPGQQAIGAPGLGVGHRRQPLRGRFQLHPTRLPVGQCHQRHGAQVSSGSTWNRNGGAWSIGSDLLTLKLKSGPLVFRTKWVAWM